MVFDDKVITAMFAGVGILAPIILNWFSTRQERQESRDDAQRKKLDEERAADYERVKQERDSAEERMEEWRAKYNQACAQNADLQMALTEQKLLAMRLERERDDLKARLTPTRGAESG